MQELIRVMQALLQHAHAALRSEIVAGERCNAGKLHEHQMEAHALAHLATETFACRELARWAERTGSPHERSIATTYIAHTLRAFTAGITLSPTERVGWSGLGVAPKEVASALEATELREFFEQHAAPRSGVDLGLAAADSGLGALGLEDATAEEIRAQFARFVNAEIIPLAQQIHQRDELIPMRIIEQMSDLGVFGLTIPEQYGGLGLSKVVMCVVTEELSRGYIGVGSLGTRAEIAAELILSGGTDAQKQHWLPRIASGETMCTAVFTEPNTGSDLAHLQTRARRMSDGGYRISGQKTWITHAARTDLMTVLARTNDDAPGYRGLSMFLAPKKRKDPGPGEEPFDDVGLTGTEIKVLGYRGMKEYEVSFDDFAIPQDALLGDEEGRGFKQLMQTFESARIQTAARATGVAQAALENALQYAQERNQFGRPILEFPRIAAKIGSMLAKTQAARQLTYFSARRKDSGARCDLEAGMAKLLATQAAWECADANVQIHGGNGYAEEYLASRLLVDSRVLSIFEGTSEIQAGVIARRLLEMPSIEMDAA